MKKRTFLEAISFVMVILMLVGSCAVFSVSANTTGVTKDGFAYEISDGKVTITGYASDNPKVNIPSSIEGYPVTAIGRKVFSSNISAPRKITEVTIPDTVTSIGVSAFSGTSIESLVIPDSVTSIGASAFYWCQLLEEITLPDSIEFIGETAFHYSGYYNNQKNWKNDMLYINSALISAKDSISGDCRVKDGTTIIADKAFYGCKSLKSVTIPEGIKSIGDYTFYECTSLESVTIPESVTDINAYAFAWCSSLKTAEIPAGVTQIGEYAFFYCSSLESAVIPETVTSIGESAFTACSSIDAVVIPKGVTSIGKTAFSICTSLKSVVISEGVTSIGDRAFAGCSSLVDVSIPNSLKSIGDDAFSDCSSLGKITIPEGVTHIGENPFNNTAYYNNEENWQDGVLYIDQALISIHSFNFKDNKEYIVKDGITVIADYAFYNGTSLESLTIPSSVKVIGYESFGGCRYLKTIVLSDGIVSIGGRAFDGCRSLSNLTIPESVTYIGDHTFTGCSVLTDVYYGGSELQWKNAVVYGYTYGYGAPNINLHFLKENVYIAGDADSNGVVNVKDATQIQKAVASIVSLDDAQTLMADADFNGDINVKDATLIQKWVAGIDVNSSIGEEIIK